MGGREEGKGRVVGIWMWRSIPSTELNVFPMFEAHLVDFSSSRTETENFWHLFVSISRFVSFFLTNNTTTPLPRRHPFCYYFKHFWCQHLALSTIWSASSTRGGRGMFLVDFCMWIGTGLGALCARVYIYKYIWWWGPEQWRPSMNYAWSQLFPITAGWINEPPAPTT